jgi:predicted transcriptional regulator
VGNVTISLPDDLLRDVRHLAVDEGVSLSRFVARTLEQQVERRRAYAAARDRDLQSLRETVPRGTGGHISWTRDSLHER